MSNETLLINGTEIQLAERQETYLIPVRTVCEAIGVDYSGQIAFLKDHPSISKGIFEETFKASDGKNRSMVCLPIKYALSWLLFIDTRKVKPESAEQLLKYQDQAYEVIYERFFLEPVLQKEKLILLLDKEKQLMELENQRRELGSDIRGLKDEIETIKATEPKQLKLKF